MAGLLYGASTNIGNVRGHNEDSYLAEPSLGLWLVADGMGGHAAGEVASDIVVRSIGSAIANGSDLIEAIQSAHRDVLEASEDGIGKKGMGSTVVAIHVCDLNYKIAWVGDSRAYLWNGKLKQISKDHSLVQMLVDTGNLSEREAMHHPQKNIIYQHMGEPDKDELNIGIIEGRFCRGQKILLCSDGLSDELPKDEIADVLARTGSEQEIADGLISQVLETTANDNVTVILVAAPDDAPEDTGEELSESEKITVVGE
ncbi:MAG: protein phosphatase 2C domain-containing protein [Gammaproteobacteria bacterium]|nr:protein phosphatase 2C domain-containing protein [Gammaproteobacteria bacterium]